MSSTKGKDILEALAAEDLLVLGTIVTLPWLYGGVGISAYGGAAAVIAAAAGWALARRGPSGLGLGRRLLWLLPAFFLGAWAFFQVVPLPRAVVAVLSPVAAKHQEKAYGAGQDGATAWLRGIEGDARARVPEAARAVADPNGTLALGADDSKPPRWFTLSMQRDMTLDRAFWYAALLLVFLLVHRRTADSRRAAVYRAVLLALFGVLALVGILNRLTAMDRVLWLRAAPPTTHPFGPYINPDHFAGTMELATPWLLGYGLVALSSRSGGRMRAGHVLALFGAAGCAAAGLLTASKTAAVTIAVSSAALIAIAAWRGPRRARFALAGVAAAVFVVLAAVALYGPLRGRVNDFLAVKNLGSAEGRTLAWSVGIRMANDYALTGSGFGAFREVFPGYQPGGDADVWLQMHNDYLELYQGGGLIAVALVAWLAVAVALRAARVLRAEFALGRGLAALGLATALCAMAAHELVDFNLQVPANALLFVALTALGVSSARAGEVP